MIECAIVIVNYNVGELLTEAVASVVGAASEVVVVDNASRDGSATALEARFGDRIRVLHNGQNLGFAAACNIGIAASTAPRVLFLNPDARLEPGALARLVEILDSDPAIGMVGPRVLAPDGTELRGDRRRLPTIVSGFSVGFGLRRLLRRTDFNQHRDPLPAGPADVEAISGGCMMVKRAAIASVGLWDEGYFLHVEDLDYCARFARGGWRIVFVPDAGAVHVQGASSSSRPVFVEWHKHLGMMRYYDKFLSAGWSRLIAIPIKAGILVRFAVTALRLTLARLLARPAAPDSH